MISEEREKAKKVLEEIVNILETNDLGMEIYTRPTGFSDIVFWSSKEGADEGMEVYRPDMTDLKGRINFV